MTWDLNLLKWVFVPSVWYCAQGHCRGSSTLCLLAATSSNHRLFANNWMHNGMMFHFAVSTQLLQRWANCKKQTLLYYYKLIDACMREWEAALGDPLSQWLRGSDQPHTWLNIAICLLMCSVVKSAVRARTWFILATNWFCKQTPPTKSSHLMNQVSSWEEDYGDQTMKKKKKEKTLELWLTDTQKKIHKKIVSTRFMALWVFDSCQCQQDLHLLETLPLLHQPSIAKECVGVYVDVCGCVCKLFHHLGHRSRR